MGREFFARVAALVVVSSCPFVAFGQSSHAPPVKPQYTIAWLKSASVEDLIRSTWLGHGASVNDPGRLQVPFKTLVKDLRQHRPQVRVDLLHYLQGAQTRSRDFKRTATALYAAVCEPDSTTALIPLLRSSDEQVRSAAAQELAKRPDPKALVPLIDACLGRGGPLVRDALKALKSYSFEAVAPQLRVALKDPSSARAATDALAVFGKAATDDLLRLLKSPSPSVFDSAARGLIGLAEPRAIDALLEAVDKRHPWPVSQALAPVLSKMGPKALNGVLKLADDDRPDMREWAFDALAQIGGPAAERRVIEGLSDPDALCRDQAARALAQRLPASARKWATANARSGVVEHRYLARLMFETLRDKDAVAKVSVPDHYAGGSRNSAITDLLRFEDFKPENRARAQARLERLYATGDEHERGKALLALAKIAGADATPLLARALSDRKVWPQALIALMEVGDKRALPALRKLQVEGHGKDMRDRAIASILNPSRRGRY